MISFNANTPNDGRRVVIGCEECEEIRGGSDAASRMLNDPKKHDAEHEASELKCVVEVAGAPLLNDLGLWIS